MNAPEIWTARDIATWLGLSFRYVADRVTKREDFPSPIIAGKGVRARWLKAAVIRWADRDGLLSQ